MKILQSRSVLRPNKLIGSFKLDIATVWLQKGNKNHLYLVSVPCLFLYSDFRCTFSILHECYSCNIITKKKKHFQFKCTVKLIAFAV